jgi:formamidopyrimidine-DNA glycosylase
MPELPEVETIRTQLSSALPSQVLATIDVLWAGSLRERESIALDILGQRVENVWRRGKVLGITFTNNTTMLVHLKMTGQLIYSSDASIELVKTTRLVFNFTSGARLLFNDQRKFGWVVITPTDKVALTPLLSTMGPEPLGPEFSATALKDALAHHPRLSIKAALLDQRVVSGIGNIYVDELLWTARVNPNTKCSDLTKSQTVAITKAVVSVLRTGVRLGGSTMRDYVDSTGSAGHYLDQARVVGRTGLACYRCSTLITKIRVAGRGTCYCPTCQPL